MTYGVRGTMSEKKRSRRKAIMALVIEQGAESFDVSMQTIRRDVDALSEGDKLHSVHGRIELSREFMNTLFDQRESTNLVGKRVIGEAAANLSPDFLPLFTKIEDRLILAGGETT
jgi:DeoR family glycerol-3-phosphate regulon repressor